MSEIFSDATLEHRCEDGHYWREHTNGQVTPSWGLGGTFIDVPDPALCPEPATDGQGLYRCRSCGTAHRPGDGLRGMSFTPWEFGPGKRQECEVPPPGCRKPAVWTRRWGDQYLPWPDGPGPLYSLWWLTHRTDGKRLVCYLGGGVSMGSEAIDLHTGELLQISHPDPAFDPARTRPASVRDAPEHLRSSWPKPGSHSEGGVSTTWLLAHTNPQFQALCRVHEQGLLVVQDHEREFMWLVKQARQAGLRSALAERVSRRGWQVADADELAAAVERETASRRDRQAATHPPPAVQLGLGI